MTVVSSQPQSTTRPVIRPQAFRASTAEDVNETEGTWHELYRKAVGELTLRFSNNASAMCSLTHAGRYVFSITMTLRDFGSVMRCLPRQPKR